MPKEVIINTKEEESSSRGSSPLGKRLPPLSLLK